MTKNPLNWPAGWKRTPGHSRRPAAFSKDKHALTIAAATNRVMAELARFGVDTANNVILSSDLILNRDGSPRSNQPEPHDPGVAVYWKKGKDTQHKVMAADRYRRVADNLAAIAATLDAMRAIERHGGAVILERAFTGFQALPAPNTWRAVLEFHPDQCVTLKMAREKYHALAQVHHPDKGGLEAKMKELNWAMAEVEREFAEAEKELGA